MKLIDPKGNISALFGLDEIKYYSLFDSGNKPNLSEETKKNWIDNFESIIKIADQQFQGLQRFDNFLSPIYSVELNYCEKFIDKAYFIFLKFIQNFQNSFLFERTLSEKFDSFLDDNCYSAVDSIQVIFMLRMINLLNEIYRNEYFRSEESRKDSYINNYEIIFSKPPEEKKSEAIQELTEFLKMNSDLTTIMTYAIEIYKPPEEELKKQNSLGLLVKKAILHVRDAVGKKTSYEKKVEKIVNFFQEKRVFWFSNFFESKTKWPKELIKRMTLPIGN